jgi:uncharacterized membrane protein YsdA (DUF1294 family)/cold shock CspA family protein
VRYQGKLTDWKDDQGFGFITPNGGGPRVFVHIRSFSNRQRRPAGNERVTYVLTQDARGRPQAAEVAFAGTRAAPAAPSGPGNVAPMLTAAFLAVVAGAAFTGKLPVVVAWFYLAASAAAFVAYALDKSAARNGRWRSRESTLHLIGLAGGWPGALAAQRLLRHKSRKPSFQVAFWATVVLNCCALAWLLSDSGEALRSMLASG